MARAKVAKIPGLERKPKRKGRLFGDLEPEGEALAKFYFDRMLAKRRRRGLRVPHWLRPILVGQARRLAKNPPTSSWGRSMRAKKGGYAVQERYRLEGRDPLEEANRARQNQQQKPVRWLPTLRNQRPPQF